MEMVGVGFAVMLIFLPLTLPAFILAQNGRWLEVAAGSRLWRQSRISLYGSKWSVNWAFRGHRR
jgi:hypothetical protein